MRNLMSAGFARLWRSKALWFSCVFLAGEVISALWTRYTDRRDLNVVNYIDGGFFYFLIFIGIFIAVLCALHLGSEHSDGTLRNKLVIGCKRRDIYLANLVVCSTGTFVMCLSSVIPGLCMGIPLLGTFHMGAARAVFMLVGAFALTLGMTAIFTLLSMLVTNRAISAVVSMLVMLTFMAVGVYADSRLQAEPTVPGLHITTMDALTGELGDPIIEETPNPLYLPEGPVRDFYEFIHDFTPGGQMMQYASLSATKFELLISYNFIIIFLTTIVGITLFNNKDLK